MREPNYWIEYFTCKPFVESEETREIYDRYFHHSRSLSAVTHPFKRLVANPNPTAKGNLLRFVDSMLAVELMLGLSKDKCNRPKGLYKQEVFALSTRPISDDVLELFLESHDSEYICLPNSLQDTESVVDAISHFYHLKMSEDQGDHPMLRITKQDFDEGDGSLRYRFPDLIILLPTGLELDESINGLYYFHDSENNTKYCIKIDLADIYRYDQPSSESLMHYIQLRQNLVRYSLNVNRFVQEENVTTYLNWVYQILLAIESRNSMALSQINITHELTGALASDYPVVPKVVDFYKRKSAKEKCKIERDRLGYTTYASSKPIIDNLKMAIQRLSETKENYYGSCCQKFHNETTINSNLKDKIHCENRSLLIELEKKINSSLIDIDITYGIDKLAVEAKIAYKNKYLKNAVEKALFTQAPDYGENVNYDSCAILYVFDYSLRDFYARISDHIKKVPKYTLTTNKPMKYDHLILKSTLNNVESVLDVLVVCLKKESNSKRHSKK
ncbi:hypothetical protein ACRZ5S_22345 (plasmid) [Vibrio scophthalmi]|uniref:hypothetical protein n=1 Tax=Vibrio scophthalmi TaxID=45658 RepID=UPI003EB7823C